MAAVGAIVRFLMLAACLVPFTSARQATIALAPHVPLTPVSPASEAPAPVREEDDERETDSKERLNAQSKYRPTPRVLSGCLHRCHVSRHTSGPYAVRTTPPGAADPFRNGLGSPYRC